MRVVPASSIFFVGAFRHFLVIFTAGVEGGFQNDCDPTLPNHTKTTFLQGNVTNQVMTTFKQFGGHRRLILPYLFVLVSLNLTNYFYPVTFLCGWTTIESLQPLDSKLNSPLESRELSFVHNGTTSALQPSDTLDSPIESTQLNFVQNRNAPSNHDPAPTLRYYIVETPETTTWIIGNYTKQASRLYKYNLNEKRAEIWLHRAFESGEMSRFRTMNASEADVFVVTGYFNLIEMMIQTQILQAKHTLDPDKWIEDFLATRIIDKTRPHLILVPCTSYTTLQNPLVKAMVLQGINLWSVGLERNIQWQVVPKDRIIPIPYVVEPSHTKEEMTATKLNEKSRPQRTNNFVFYSGDVRPQAIRWAGCNRVKLLSKLLNTTNDNMDVRIVSSTDRLSQTEYNNRMETSDFCLIMCGDTPSSRSLTSAVVNGCIPIRVGSRWRGLCEPPCKGGWGWIVTGPEYPHFPYPELVDWNSFPEIDEPSFASKPHRALQKVFAKVGPKEKQELRAVMEKTRLGWIYGWGNPVKSTEFGDAPLYVWKSFVDAFQKEEAKLNAIDSTNSIKVATI